MYISSFRISLGHNFFVNTTYPDESDKTNFVNLSLSLFGT